MTLSIATYYSVDNFDEPSLETINEQIVAYLTALFRDGTQRAAQQLNKTNDAKYSQNAAKKLETSFLNLTTWLRYKVENDELLQDFVALSYDLYNFGVMFGATKDSETNGEVILEKSNKIIERICNAVDIKPFTLNASSSATATLDVYDHLIANK